MIAMSMPTGWMHDRDGASKREVGGNDGRAVEEKSSAERVSIPALLCAPGSDYERASNVRPRTCTRAPVETVNQCPLPAAPAAAAALGSSSLLRIGSAEATARTHEKSSSSSTSRKLGRRNDNRSGAEGSRDGTDCNRTASKSVRWTDADDALLKELVDVKGVTSWRELSETHFGGRLSGSALRSRYVNRLAFGRELRKWTEEEDTVILRGFAQYGNKWTLIAQQLEGRVGNDVRNRFRRLQSLRERNNQ